MNQLADTFLELRKYEFPLVGSFNYPGSRRISALA